MPTMKIVGLPPFSGTIDTVIPDILTTNNLNVADFTYVRHFSVELFRRRYVNVLVTCTVENLKKCMSSGLQFGRFKLRCYEHVRVVQCLKCFAFGHVAANCLNKLTCKRCAGEHKENECQAKTNEIRCANCISSKRAHDHRITSENCPSRKAWINRKINFLGKRIKEQGQEA